jgi:hypothetical protein
MDEIKILLTGFLIRIVIPTIVLFGVSYLIIYIASKRKK